MRHYWVDRIEVTDPGVRGVGFKAVGLSEDVFEHHFPGNAIFPGIYILEGIAQTGGAVIVRAGNYAEFALMVSIDRARFSSFARPGDLLQYAVSVEGRNDDMAHVLGVASVGERQVAQARMTFRILPLSEIVPELYQANWNQALEQMFERGEREASVQNSD